MNSTDPPIERARLARFAGAAILLCLSACASSVAGDSGDDASGDSGDAIVDGSSGDLNDIVTAEDVPDSTVDIAPLDIQEDVAQEDVGIDIVDALDAIDDVLPDTVDPCAPADAPLGCACISNEECASEYCLQRGPADFVCSRFCSGPEDECEHPSIDFQCSVLENDAGDLVRLCAPPTSSQCLPCPEGQCASLGAVCSDLDDGLFCLERCEGDGFCRDGGRCEERGGQQVCVPPDNICSGCLDNDADLHGVGSECLGLDCDDNAPEIYSGAPELCDGNDNDCDGFIDEEFDLATDPQNCGGCGVVCSFENATGMCVDGQCELAECDEGYVNCDLDDETGCEAEGVPEDCPSCESFPDLEGEACGDCGSYACDADGRLICADEGSNVCGGCDLLGIEGAAGDPCGVCDEGTLVCASRELMVCAGDPGSDALNACGGCAPLPAEPATPCGTCDSGVWICDESPDFSGVTCFGDAGVDATNACGGCEALIADPGSTCGPCGLDVYACDGTEAVACSGPTTCAGAPEAPTNVQASDGSSADSVSVTWALSAGATNYEVYRDGALLGTATAPPFVDRTVMLGGAPAAPLALSASDAAFTDRVEVSWAQSPAADGPTYSYTVVATTPDETSPPSAADTGFAGASTVLGYELEVNGVWTDVGGALAYVDRDAPAGAVEPGVADATDGEFSDRVDLALTGERLREGAAVTYRVRGYNAVGVGAASDPVDGSRTVGALSYQWERSAADLEEDYAGITGATSSSASDLAPPSDGSGRFYRCRVEAEGAEGAYSAADRGFAGCPPNTFGLDCAACPGVDCWGNGACDDGIIGSGVCACDDGAHGGACEFSCSDGERNGDEVGVDCGGSCSACAGDWSTRIELPFTSGGNFQSIATDGQTLVVGSSSEYGEVRVFEWDGDRWSAGELLLPSETTLNTGFGSSVAVRGSVIAVAAVRDNDYRGAVHMFRRVDGEWAAESILRPDSAPQSERFGSGVALGDGIVVIGADGNDDRGSDAGTAYIYGDSSSGWVLEAQLLANDAVSGARLGSSVAFDGGRIALGSTGSGTTSLRTGALYLFEFDGLEWAEFERIAPIDASNGTSFGSSVSIVGHRIAVGATGANDRGTRSGAVYVYQRDSAGAWQLDARLIDSAAGVSEGRFGTSVSISDSGVLAVGAEEYATSDGPGLYVYRRSAAGEWARELRTNAPSASTTMVAGQVAVAPGAIGCATTRGAVVWQSCGDTSAATACAPTCHDGVLNGDEEDVDCGGDCGVCQELEYASTRVVAPDVAESDFFGSAIAANQRWLAVSSPSDDDRGSDSGSVYVFSREPGAPSFRAKLTAPDGTANQGFGRRMALCGDNLYVGVGQTTSSAVYHFALVGESWLHVESLRPEFGSSRLFGQTIACVGDTLAVSRGDDVYVYESGPAGFTLGQTLSSTATVAGLDMAARTIVIHAGNSLRLYERQASSYVPVARPRTPPGSGQTAVSESGDIAHRSNDVLWLFGRTTSDILTADFYRLSRTSGAVAIDETAVVIGDPASDTVTVLLRGYGRATGTCDPIEIGADGDGIGTAVEVVMHDVMGAASNATVSGLTGAGAVYVYDACPGDMHGHRCQYSCSDGAQSGLEEGVDCGGPCSACVE